MTTSTRLEQHLAADVMQMEATINRLKDDLRVEREARRQAEILYSQAQNQLAEAQARPPVPMPPPGHQGERAYQVVVERFARDVLTIHAPNYAAVHEQVGTIEGIVDVVSVTRL
jgi:hypothetical protein